MSSRDLAFNLIGNAQSAVTAFNQTGDAAERNQARFDAVKTGITLASAAMVAGVSAFASSSIDAYKEAEGYQAQLQAAYEKFPAIASVNIDALRELNSAIQAKTGYDDDQLAASQATLAQFGLTGEQIAQLTPLMVDYASKTGKDVTTAAEDMGKAMMGQGRALKTVGVDFSDTGSAAGNFDQIVAGLDGTVGGFATTMGDTAAGKAQILQTTFGDLQETIGELLVPALVAITDIALVVTQWLSDNPALVQALAIAVGVLTVALIAANIAMWAMAANPIVLLITAIVVAVGLLIAGIWLLVANWDAVVAWISTVWQGFVSWLVGVVEGFVGWWNSIWAAVGQFIVDVWNNFLLGIQLIWGGLSAWLTGALLGLVGWWNSMWAGVGQFAADVWRNFTSGIQAIWGGFSGWITGAISGFGSWIGSTWRGIWDGLGGIVRNVWNGVLGFVEGGVNGAINLINGMIGAVNSVGGVVGINIGVIPNVRLPRLATGGLTSGPMAAIIGDNPGGRELVSPLDRVERHLTNIALAAVDRSGADGDVTIVLSGDAGPLLEQMDLRAVKVVNQYEAQRKTAARMGRQRSR